MGNRVALSPERLEFEEVAIAHSDIANSIRFYYGQASMEALDAKFIGYTLGEVEQERDKRLEELDKNSAFNVLAALEASFRVDFLMRCYNRRKDDLSRFFRRLLKDKGERSISLDQHILEGWRICSPQSKSLISQVKAAFRYRHWLAHGRYLNPKLGREYDFDSVYLLAQAVDQGLPLHGSE
jgi:hypothetical protein